MNPNNRKPDSTDEVEQTKIRRFVYAAVSEAYETCLGGKFGILNRRQTRNAEMSDLHDTADAAWLDAAMRLGYAEPSTPSQGESTYEPECYCDEHGTELCSLHKTTCASCGQKLPQNQCGSQIAVEPKEAQTWPEAVVRDETLRELADYYQQTASTGATTILDVCRELQAYRELKKRSEGRC